MKSACKRTVRIIAPVCFYLGPACCNDDVELLTQDIYNFVQVSPAVIMSCKMLIK
jgi:hypothetical protein